MRKSDMGNQGMRTKFARINKEKMSHYIEKSASNMKDSESRKARERFKAVPNYYMKKGGGGNADKEQGI